MDDIEMRSPLATKDHMNVMHSGLRPPSKLRLPSAVKRQRTDADVSNTEPRAKVVKRSDGPRSEISAMLRRQTTAAITRKVNKPENNVPPMRRQTSANNLASKKKSTTAAATSISTTMRRQTSAGSLPRKGPTTGTRNLPATKPPPAKPNVTKTKGGITGADAKAAAGKAKRAAWDYKGRLGDMENIMQRTSHQMTSLTSTIDENKGRIGTLESINRELEGTVQIKQRQTEQASAKIQDLQAQILVTEDELRSFQLKHDFEIEVQKNKIRSVEMERDELHRQLTTSRDETAALRSSVAQMTAQSLGITTELQATKIQFQAACEDGRCKAEKISTLESHIEQLQKTIEENEAKLRVEESTRRELHNTIQELKGNIRVFCRVRPSLQSESGKAVLNFALQDDGRGIAIEPTNSSEDVTGTKRGPQKFEFNFDKVFHNSSQQGDVFEEISQLVQSALDGYNVCIFAYGQTGSGKTYTMEGDRSQHESRGMIPRSMEQVFQCTNQLREKGWRYKMEVSFLEIYNETIRDLLGSGDESVKHDIKLASGSSTACQEVMVTNLKTFQVNDENQVYNLLNKAAQNRAVAATKCNERSSRSHSVFIMKLTGENTLTDEKCTGTLNLVDLAGSERLDQSCSTGDRLKETKSINKSLSTLSTVIIALANKEGHIPYRNSKLTYLLKNSLGGNSKSLMFVNVSPREESLQETLCSLRFATKVNQCNIGTAQKKVGK